MVPKYDGSLNHWLFIFLQFMLRKRREVKKGKKEPVRIKILLNFLVCVQRYLNPFNPEKNLYINCANFSKGGFGKKVASAMKRQ